MALIKFMFEFYHILEYFIKCGEAFEIINDGASLKYLPDKMCPKKERGTSALCIHDISLRNKIEEYEWVFNLDNVPCFKSRFNKLVSTQNINIGIINTEVLNINILNVNAQKLAVDDKIKEYSINLNGTNSWMASGEAIQSVFKLQDKFKVNDKIRMIFNLKYRCLAFKQNETILFCYKNCEMDISTTFNMYCTLTGIEKNFQISLIDFKRKKYISKNSIPLCQRISATFDKGRDEVLLEKEVTVWVFDGYENDDDRSPIWNKIGKGKLSIYNDKIVTIANYSRIIFREHESHEIKLLQFIKEETEIYHAGDDYIEYNGYDLVKDTVNSRNGCWKIQFHSHSTQQCVKTFIDILKHKK